MTPSGPSHILYVDDDPDMRMLVKSTLENSGGMRVTLCSSAIEILEDAIANKPDMIILDVMMPVMDGMAILSEIKSDKRINDIPVIFLTSQTREHEIKKFMSLGVAGVIAKPFDLTALPAQVKGLWQQAKV